MHADIRLQLEHENSTGTDLVEYVDALVAAAVGLGYTVTAATINTAAHMDCKPAS